MAQSQANIKITPLDQFGNPVGQVSTTASWSLQGLSCPMVLIAKAIDPKRGTGRTSKMLWAAAQMKDQGEEIMIVVHDQSMIRYCLTEPMKGGWWGLEPQDFETIERAADRARGRRLRNCYVDHFVEESAMGSRLVMKCYRDLETALYDDYRHIGTWPQVMPKWTAADLAKVINP